METISPRLSRQEEKANLAYCLCEKKRTQYEAIYQMSYKHVYLRNQKFYLYNFISKDNNGCA